MSEKIKKEEISKKTIVDTTTIITIGGIVLYQLGWLYWETYFKKFNIDSSFIELSIEKIITTTWITLAAILICFYNTFEIAYKNGQNKEIPVLDGTIRILGAILVSLIGYGLINGTTFCITSGVTILIIAIVPKKYSERNFSIKKYLIGTVAILYCLSFYFYVKSAEREANTKIENYDNDIEIVLNHDNKTIKGKFITFMNDKYFILVENYKCKRETLVINNSEIYRAKLLTKQ